jgi:predicted acetyltransferase
MRGLASLYSGFRSPLELAIAGLATGSEEQLLALEPVFAGSAPWMTDHF